MQNHKIIPIVKAETLIPSGTYCYTPVEAPCEQNGWVFRIKLCPFWQYREDIAELHGEQAAGYCGYLRKGDWDGDTCEINEAGLLAFATLAADRYEQALRHIAETGFASKDWRFAKFVLDGLTVEEAQQKAEGA